MRLPVWANVPEAAADAAPRPESGHQGQRGHGTTRRDVTGSLTFPFLPLTEPWSQEEAKQRGIPYGNPYVRGPAPEVFRHPASRRTSPVAGLTARLAQLSRFPWPTGRAIPLVQPPRDVGRRQGGHHHEADQDEIQPERQDKPTSTQSAITPTTTKPQPVHSNTLRRCSRAGSRRPASARPSGQAESADSCQPVHRRARPRSRAGLLSRPWHGRSPGACAFRRPLMTADSAGEPPQPVKVGGAKRIRAEPQHALAAGRIDREARGVRPLLTAPAIGGGSPDTQDPSWTSCPLATAHLRVARRVTSRKEAARQAGLTTYESIRGAGPRAGRRAGAWGRHARKRRAGPAAPPAGVPCCRSAGPAADAPPQRLRNSFIAAT